MKLLALSSFMLLAAALSAAQESGIPAVFNPVMTVSSLAPKDPSNITYGSFRLTPASCSATMLMASAGRPRRRHRKEASTSGVTATTGCTGFDLSNSSSFNSKVNSATVNPRPDAPTIDPWNTATYEIGSFTLTNKGLTQPAGGNATLVPIAGNITFNTPGVNKPTNVRVRFNVAWTTDTSSNADTFSLVTKPSYTFNIYMTTDITFQINLQLVGFTADGGAVVLGDVGQQNPPAGTPGPRVYIKKNSPPQVVKLIGQISKSA